MAAGELPSTTCRHREHDVIGEEKQQSYFVDTLDFVQAERAAGKAIYPPAKDVFNAFRFTEFNDVKVVILGQDPYHGPNQAHGLCFSVLPGIKPPPSLANMYKELAHRQGQLFWYKPQNYRAYLLLQRLKYTQRHFHEYRLP